MATAFTKPLVEVTRDDIKQIVAERHQEGEDLEFKQALPTEDGKPDCWETDGNRIGAFARNKLLSEVIAFANAHGGHLLLGVAETRDKPARADKLTPVDHCVELAERLRQQINHCIEPKLPMVHVQGIKTGRSRGVVIFRVPESRLAPHRLNQDKECYVRRNDRCEKMTMREIQDLVLARSRSAAEIENRFEMRQRTLAEAIRLQQLNHVDRQIIRVTAMPIGADFFVSPIFGVEALAPSSGSIRVAPESQEEIYFQRLSFDRPILRGVRYRAETSNRDGISGHNQHVFAEVESDGLVEYRQYQDGQDTVGLLRRSDVLGLAIHAMITADRFRRHANFPEAEYAMEVLIARTNGEIRLDVGLENTALVEPNPLPLPRYSIGTRDEFGQILGLIYTDVLHAGGQLPSTRVAFKPDLPA